MAAKKSSKPKPEAEGLLVAAARTLGHAVGEAAKAVGIEGGEVAPPAPAKRRKGAAPKGKAKPKRASARSRRVARAAELKQKAASLAKGPAAEKVRFRRIMGKPATAWSDSDIEFIAGLGAPEPATAQE